jgi:large subunit ribosomal protein L7Ae
LAAKGAKTTKASLFEKRPRNFRIGGDVLPKPDLARFTKWPKYIQLQRQKRILLERVKAPPAIAQFHHTTEKSQTAQLLKLLQKYTPEDRKQKKERLQKTAANKVAKKDQNPADKPVVLKYGLNHVTQLVEEKKARLVAAAEAGATSGSAPGPVLKYGLNHVTTLIEQKKAQLVVIASDVDPIELVCWLPALCRKKDVPYCIVKSKSRLGQLVHKKTASCLALTQVNKEDTDALNQLCTSFKSSFNNNVDVRRKWSEGKPGRKSFHVLEARRKAVEAEQAKKLGLGVN